MNYTSLILSLSGALLVGAASAQSTTVRIGVLAPVTGSIAAIGVDVKRGAELAINERKAEFAQLGLNLEMVLLDDQGDATTGAAAVENAMKDPLMLGVVGPTKSGVSLKVGQMLAKSGAPMAFISPASTNDDLTKNGWNYFFRVTSPDGAQADTAANYIAREIRPKSVFIVTDNQTFGNGIAEVLTAELKTHSIPSQLGAANVGDTRAQATLIERISAAKPDLVFYTGLYDGGGPFIRALRAAGVTTPFMGGNGLDSPEFIRLAQGDAGGVRYITGFGPVQNYSNGYSYVTRFQKAFNAPPAVRSAFTYDAVNTMLTAISTVFTATRHVPSRAALISALHRTSTPTDRNVTGAIAFTTTGERRSSPMFVVQIDRSTLVPTVVNVTRYSAR